MVLGSTFLVHEGQTSGFMVWKEYTNNGFETLTSHWNIFMENKNIEVIKVF